MRKRLDEAAHYLRLDASRTRLAELEAELSRPDLWADTEVGQRVNREYGQTKADVDLLDGLAARISDAETLYELATEEGDDSLAPELEAIVAAAAAELDALELRSLFTGEHDDHDAVCEIHAKDGGTDAQDWAEMMLRMYQRWAERRGFELEIEDVSPGQEAGILSVSFIIRGRYATGLLTSERGVHRLVRISPFDAQARRHTSFASMNVVPFFEDLSGEVDIDEKDLRIDTYRSSGAGGQHVNVTDSAVRITHLPDRHGGVGAERTVAAPEQGQGHADPGFQAGGAAAGGARRRAVRHGRTPGVGGLGRPDPLLRAGAVPAGQGSAHGPRNRQRAGGAGWRSGPLHGGLLAVAPRQGGG